MPTKPPSKERLQFAKRLAAARIAAGFDTAEEFAKVVGIPAPGYRRNERDGTLPKFEHLIKIAAKLDEDIHFLFTGRLSDKAERSARKQAAA